MAEKDDNLVFVGRKPIMNHDLAYMTLSQSGANDVFIKARGNAVSRAVDVAEIVRRRFLPNVKVKDVRIDTEQITREEAELHQT